MELIIPIDRVLTALGSRDPSGGRSDKGSWVLLGPSSWEFRGVRLFFGEAWERLRAVFAGDRDLLRGRFFLAKLRNRESTCSQKFCSLRWLSS